MWSSRLPVNCFAVSQFNFALICVLFCRWDKKRLCTVLSPVACRNSFLHYSSSSSSSASVSASYSSFAINVFFKFSFISYLCSASSQVLRFMTLVCVQGKIVYLWQVEDNEETVFVNCTWIHSNGQMYQKWPIIGEVLVSDTNTVNYVCRSALFPPDIKRHCADRGRSGNQILMGRRWGRYEVKI